MEPGKIARGKPEIRKAFDAIAAQFNHTLHVSQKEMLFQQYVPPMPLDCADDSDAPAPGWKCNSCGQVNTPRGEISCDGISGCAPRLNCRRPRGQNQLRLSCGGRRGGRTGMACPGIHCRSKSTPDCQSRRRLGASRSWCASASISAGRARTRSRCGWQGPGVPTARSGDRRPRLASTIPPLLGRSPPGARAGQYARRTPISLRCADRSCR